MAELPVTALIVARDEAANIARCVAGIRPAVAEVLVVDTGSTDDTVALAEAAGARVLRSSWLGYGQTKNWGAERARYPWIVSLDADEVPDETLLRALSDLDLHDARRAYGMLRITRYVDRWIRHGSWRGDVVWRVYHRTYAHWNTRAVHEELVAHRTGGSLERERLPGELLHYSYPTRAHLARKHDTYIRLGVEALAAEGRRATWSKRHLAPAWRLVRSYLLRGGWRDGRAGWEIALADFRMVREKYRRLARSKV